MADTITANISSYPTAISASLSTYMTSISTNFVETTLEFLDGAGLNIENTFSQDNHFLQDVSIDGDLTGVDSITFDTTALEASAVGKLKWNDEDGTLDLGLKGGNVTLQIGQETVIRAVNKTNTDLLEANYQVARIRTEAEGGSQGQRLAIVLAQANNDNNSVDTLGLVTENIDNNQEGFVTTFGLVRGINTTGSLQFESWSDGDVLYLSPTIAGRLTNIKPQAPQHTVIVGFVVYSHRNNGKIFVKVDNGYEIDELHNVKINGVTNNSLLAYDSALSVWKNTNSINVNTLSATTLSADRIYTTQLDALSANITVIDIKQYELSGFNIQGNSTIQGNVSASGSVTANNLVYKGGNTEGAALTIGTNDAQDLNFETNGSTRMIITSAGAVGFGTPPTIQAGFTFEVAGQSKFANQLYLGSNLRMFGSTPLIAGDNLRFTNGNSVEIMRLSTNGNVGIGTTTPTQKLDVVGKIQSTTDSNSYSNFYAVSNGGLYPRAFFGIKGNTGYNNVALTVANDSNDGVERRAYLSLCTLTNAAANTAHSLLMQIHPTYGEIVACQEASTGNLPLHLYSGVNNNKSSGISIVPNANNGVTTSNVGIRTATPNEALTVVGNISATGNLSASNIYTSNELQFAPRSAQNITQRIYSDSSDQLVLGVTSAGKRVYLGSAGNKYVANDHVSLGPLVGIGTTVPTQALTVVGNISATGNTFTSKLGVSATSLPAGVILGVGPNLINDANLPVQYSSTTPINYIGLNAQSPGTYGGLVGYTETEFGGGLILRAVPTNKAIRFVTDNNIQRMTLQGTTGNLGIGTTVPNERLTVVGNISATGTANKLPNQLADSPESILTVGEYDEYEWYPQTTSTYDKAILNGRTLRYFQAALVIDNKGTMQPFIYQPIGNRAGRFKMSIVTPTTYQYMSYDCTYYAYGTVYVGGSWNADIRRAPDVGRAWFQCTITGSPSAVVDQVITGSRGAQVTIATASTPIVNSFQVKSVSNRLPSQGEVFTTDGGTFTIAAGGILGTITDAQASYTGALIPGVGIFWPTTMPDGTFYIRGHTTL